MTEVEKRIKQYCTTLKYIYDNIKVKKVRYHDHMANIFLMKGVSMQNYCSTHKRDTLAILLLSTFTMPQVDENNDSVLESYCDIQAFINKGTKLIPTHGFNAAYCLNTFCIGFESEVFWKDCKYRIIIQNSSNKKEIDWICISNTNHINTPDYKDWNDSITPITLIESQLDYKYKIQNNISLRDDHGKDVLLEHAKIILKNAYVESIINSLRFNSHTSKYILKCEPSGIIDIVLHWTDKGYGMAIKTTGRNIRETYKIAQILEKKYGRK